MRHRDVAGGEGFRYEAVVERDERGGRRRQREHADVLVVRVGGQRAEIDLGGSRADGGSSSGKAAVR